MPGIWIALEILQWVLLLFLVILVLGILRRLASLQEQTRGNQADRSKFDLGERVEDFALLDINKQQFLSEQHFSQERHLLLLFLNSGCGPCKTIIEQINELAGREGGLKALTWHFLLICQGDVQASQKLVEPLPLSDLTVLIDKDATVAQQYRIPSTPFALAIDGRGSVYSQSERPASMWLYTILDVPTPSDPSVVGCDPIPVPVLTQTTLR